MNNLQVSKTQDLFFLSTLASTIGGMTFICCMMAFLLKVGVDFASVAYLVGSIRFIPVGVMILVGDRSDRYPPIRSLIASEWLLVVSLVFVYLGWENKFYPLLYSSVIFRAICVSYQGPIRSKIAKMFGNNPEADRSLAVRLNNSMHGSAFFAGGLSYVIIRFGSFEQVIALDIATSLVAIFAAIRIRFSNQVLEESHNLKSGILKKFSAYLRYCKSPAVHDFFLAFTMMGLSSLNAKISGSRRELMALTIVGYGGAVWVSAKAMKLHWLNRLPSGVFWVMLGLSMAMFGFGVSSFWGIVFVSFLRDFFYWLLFNRISIEFQQNSSLQNAGGIAAVRMIVMTLVLGAGEYWMGISNSLLSLSQECFWRACFCAVVALFFVFAKKRNESA